MKKLEIDWSDLDTAMDLNSFEMSHYLDTETGKIELVTSEASDYAEYEDSDLEDLPEWQREGVELARRIERGHGERYIHIEPRGSREGFRDMERFIATVKKRRLKDRLYRAIEGRGAFRMFRDILADYPAEEKRWYAYRSRAAARYARDWLENRGIEPLNPLPEVEEPEVDDESEDDDESRLEDLTLLVIYLSSWVEEKKGFPPVRRAWKGYLFEVLDTLAGKGLIVSGRRSKSLTLTETGATYARELEEEFGD